MSKITVIGAGSVGATVANDLMIQGVASEIVLVDINKKKAIGEALDIYQGAPFHSPAIVRPGDYEDAEGSNIVVITCGIARKPGMSRLDLAQTNVNILKDVAANVVKYAPNAVYVIVSNPVDILTYVFTKISGLPESQIIGSGTILDTSRLQSELAKRFHISPKNVHAHVYGEHGDTQFVPWSLVHIANNHVDAYKESSPDRERIDWNQDYDEVEEFVKKSGGKIGDPQPFQSQLDPIVVFCGSAADQQYFHAGDHPDRGGIDPGARMRHSGTPDGAAAEFI